MDRATVPWNRYSMPEPYPRGATRQRSGIDAAERVINEYEYEFMLRHLTHPSQERYYNYQPFVLSLWIANMELAREWMPDLGSFLDVGCGIGGKLRAAEAMGWDVEGIERWEPYAAVARSAGFKVETIDAFDYQDYGRFDLVYVYRPCIEADDEWDLLDLIIEQMRPDTLLFHAGGGRGRSPDLEHLGENLYVVGV